MTEYTNYTIPKESRPVYSIGINSEGQTVLAIHTEFNTTTITMGENAVIKLIKLLEATLNDE